MGKYVREAANFPDPRRERQQDEIRRRKQQQQQADGKSPSTSKLPALKSKDEKTLGSVGDKHRENHPEYIATPEHLSKDQAGRYRGLPTDRSGYRHVLDANNALMRQNTSEQKKRWQGRQPLSAELQASVDKNKADDALFATPGWTKARLDSFNRSNARAAKRKAEGQAKLRKSRDDLKSGKTRKEFYDWQREQKGMTPSPKQLAKYREQNLDTSMWDEVPDNVLKGAAYGMGVRSFDISMFEKVASMAYEMGVRATSAKGARLLSPSFFKASAEGVEVMSSKLVEEWMKIDDSTPEGLARKTELGREIHADAVAHRKKIRSEAKARGEKPGGMQGGGFTLARSPKNYAIGTGLSAMLGAGIGGSMGGLAGNARGRTISGIGRGIVRGGATGGGAFLGGAAANALTDNPYAQLGGAAAGAAAGWLGSGALLGPPAHALEDKNKQASYATGVRAAQSIKVA